MAPCDINKSKQVNILVSDTGFPLTDVVIYPTTAALGYGMEYVYSILERGRLAALGGDRLMAQPVILDVGYEAWRTKEARSGDEVAELGGRSPRGPGLGGRHRRRPAPGRRRLADPASSQGPGGGPQSDERVSRRRSHLLNRREATSIPDAVGRRRRRPPEKSPVMKEPNDDYL